jgi:TP901 family phage tail tape measure protein
VADLSMTYAIIGQDLLSGPAGSAEASLGRLEGRAGTMGAAFGAAATAIAAAGVAMGAGLGLAIKTAADFEARLSAISAVSSKAELDAAGGMRALSTAALQLGKDTSFSASQAAAGMEEMVKAGISITDVLGGGARAALDLAAAGGLEVAEAATVASSAMNSFALAGSDMTHIADMLAGASVASATDVHQLGFALAAVGAVAHTVGIGFDDTTVAIAALAQAGLKGSDAGTSLKTMLLNLTPTTKAQIAVAKELGIVTADGGNKFFDAAGNAKSMAEIAGVLQTATANLTKEQKIEALQTLFGTDAIRAAAIMANLGAAGMQKMAKETAAAGSAQEIANKRLDNFKGSMEKFGGSLETAAIIVGRAFLPALRRLTDWATDALNDFIPIIEVWADTLPDAIDAAMGSIEDFARQATDAWRTVGQVLANDWQPDETIDPIVSAIGEATVAFRDEFLPTIQEAWGWVKDNSESIKAAFLGVGVAITAFTATSIGIDLLAVALATLLSPIGLVAAAGAALSVAWVNDWGGIQAKTQDFAAWFTGTAVPLIQTTLTTLSSWMTATAIPALQEWAGWLQPKIQRAWTWFTGTALPAIQTAGAAAWVWVTGTAIPALTEWAGWLQPQIQSAWTWFTGTALPTIQTLGETAWTWIMGTAVPALTELATAMQSGLQAAFDWLTGTALPAIGTAALDTANEIQNLVAWIGNVVQAILGNQQVWTDLQGAWVALKDIGAEFVRDVLGPMHQGLTDADTSTRSLADGITDLTSKIEPFIRGAQQVAEALNAAERAATNAGLALRWYLQMLGIPVPNNPIPNIVPSAPGSQSTGALPSQPPASGWPAPPSIVSPPTEGPIQGPEIPPGFDPNAAAPAAPTAAPAAGGYKYGPIDNSSRTAFVKSAWPYMLEAAGGNAQLAQMMLGAAISENGDVGKGGGFIGNNFFGIKGQGPAGSVTAQTWEMVNGRPVSQAAEFAAHNDPVQGFGGFMDFLQRNPRYAPALAAYQKSGNAQQLFQDINAAGYATDPAWAGKVANIASNQVAPHVPASGANPVSGLPDPNPPSGGLIPRGVAGFEQSQQEWDAMYSDANAICGPHLAALFASAVGRPPTRDEAVQLAEKMGIYSSAGRGSGILVASQFDEYATALIQQMNPGAPFSVSQTAATGAQAGQLAQESLAGGAPIVGFNTPGHYFGATGYDPATGKFNVGGTGTSLIGGSEQMTIQQMEALGGGITNVITLLGNFTQASTTASQSMSAVGTSAAASTTELSAIGTALDPVVASMDQGQISATQLADAIILSSENQGVAVTSTEAYKEGLITQQAAMEGVLAGFAATTPAAAELLTQLQAGAITTDQAAVAFAGLATTTATATGEIGTASDTMSQKVIGDFDTMGTTATEAVDGMTTDATTAVQGMQDDVTTATQTMGSDVDVATQTMATDATTAVTGMQDDVTVAAEGMQTDTTDAAIAMQGDVTLAATGMQTDATAAAVAMGFDVSAAAAAMANESSSTTLDMQNVITAAMQAMQADGSTAAQTLADDATGAFGDVGQAAGDLQSPLADATQAFKGTGAAAKSAVRPIEELATAAASVKPINMGDTVKNLTAVERQAKSTAKALEEVASAGKSVGSSGKSEPSDEGKGGSKGGGKAEGGLIEAGKAYLVGERGPELLLTSRPGYMVPNAGLGRSITMPDQQTQTALDIDYDKLAQAFARVQRDQNFNLTVNTSASHEPIAQDFAILESLARSVT